MSAVNQINIELDDYEKLISTAEAQFYQIYNSSVGFIQIYDRNGMCRTVAVSDLTCVEVNDSKWKVSIYHPGMMSHRELEEKRLSLVATLEKIQSLKKNSFEFKKMVHLEVKKLKKQLKLDIDDERKNRFSAVVSRFKKLERAAGGLAASIEAVTFCYKNAIYILAAGIPVDISKALERSGMLSLKPYQGTYNDLKSVFNENYHRFQDAFSQLIQMKKIIDPYVLRTHLGNLKKEVCQLKKILVEGSKIWEEGPWEHCRNWETKEAILHLAFQLEDHSSEVERLFESIGRELEALG